MSEKENGDINPIKKTILIETYKRWNEINARNIVDVIDENVGRNSFISARFDARLEDVSVVEVLHRFRTQVDAKLLELTRFSVFESEHVQNPDEAVGGVTNGVVEDGHRLARFARSGGSNCWCVLAGNLNNFKNNKLNFSVESITK